jgi:hypothetical protein
LAIEADLAFSLALSLPTQLFASFSLLRAVFVYQDAKNIVLGAKGEDGFAGALAHFHEDSRAYAVRIQAMQSGLFVWTLIAKALVPSFRPPQPS